MMHDAPVCQADRSWVPYLHYMHDLKFAIHLLHIGNFRRQSSSILMSTKQCIYLSVCPLTMPDQVMKLSYPATGKPEVHPDQDNISTVAPLMPMMTV